MVVTPTSIPAVSNGQAGAIAIYNSAFDAIDDLTAIFNGWASTDRAVKAGTLVLNVADYGAVGDGSTDDTAAIQNALTAARAVNAILRFGFGKTYIVSGTLDPSGVRIEGFGATIKVKAGVTPTWNVFQPASAFTLSDLTIDLNKANTTDPGVTTQGIGVYQFAASGWSGVTRLRDLTVINGWQAGVKFATTSAATDSLNVSTSRAIVIGLTVDACKWGVWQQNTGNITIINPEITNTVQEGIYDYFTRGTQVIGGHVDAAGVHGVVSQYSYGFHCIGVTVTSAAGCGIIMGGGSVTLEQSRRFVIQGNTVRASTLSGISVDPTKSGQSAGTVNPVYGVISGNTVETSGLHGIYLHNAQYVTVTGNTSTNNTAAATCGGLSMDSHSVTATGNVFVGNNYGIKFQGTAAGYGSHVMGRNIVSGSVTADYYYDSNGADNTALMLTGTGTPAGVVAAPVGSTFDRTDGSTNTTVYRKETGGVTSSGWVAAAGTVQAPDIQSFTGSGTWTKPSGATLVRVVLIGGGGGAGSGRRGAAGTVRCGGGGAGGSGLTETMFDPADLGSTVTVTIGGAGTGGAAVSVDDTNGNNGVAGGATTFGSHAHAAGGALGSGGTATTGSAGSGGAGKSTGGLGGTASTTGLVGGGASSGGGGGGGGAGGGVSAANAAANGGPGLSSRAIAAATSTAGVVDTTPPSTTAAPTPKGEPGPGGGGGAASITTVAQTGAAALGYGGAGGGGGASLNGSNSGAGGAGTGGYCLVITTF